MHALRPLHWLACASLLFAVTARADEALRATVLDIDGEDIVVPPGPTTPAPETSTAAADRVLVLHWRATLSRTPEQRARIYLRYLEHHPNSSHRAALLEEVRYLRALDERLRTRAALDAASAAVAAPDASSMIAMSPLTGARAGHAVDVAALLRASDVRAVLLHVRPLEAQDGFKTQPMRLDARGHARARIPAELVRAPGFAFFVELMAASSTAPAARSCSATRSA